MKVYFGKADGALWTGEFGIIRLVLSTEKYAVTVPTHALLQGPNDRYCFVLSSRSRHTIFDCDWSSDVCSSDLRRPVSGWRAAGPDRDGAAERSRPGKGVTRRERTSPQRRPAPSGRTRDARTSGRTTGVRAVDSTPGVAHPLCETVVSFVGRAGSVDWWPAVRRNSPRHRVSAPGAVPPEPSRDQGDG